MLGVFYKGTKCLGDTTFRSQVTVHAIEKDITFSQTGSQIAIFSTQYTRALKF